MAIKTIPNHRFFYYTKADGAVETFCHIGINETVDELKSMLGLDDFTLIEGSPNDEHTAGIHRETRNHLLRETDGLIIGDRTNQLQLKSYRQSLRDLTTHANWPNLEEDDWPVFPGQFDS